MSRAAGDALAQTVATVLAGGQCCLYYTLTSGARRDRLVRAHQDWRGDCENNLGVGPEFVVVEPHASGDPHLHGLVLLPEQFPRGFTRVDVHAGVIPYMAGTWWRCAGVPRSARLYAARIEPVRDVLDAARYCAKFIRRGRDVDYFLVGEWPSLGDLGDVAADRARGGRPPTAMQRARAAIMWLREQRVTSSLEVYRNLESWIAEGRFSRRTFDKAKAEAGIRSTVELNGPLQPGAWRWVVPAGALTVSRPSSTGAVAP
jgi:hypothetical protein